MDKLPKAIVCAAALITAAIMAVHFNNFGIFGWTAFAVALAW